MEHLKNTLKRVLKAYKYKQKDFADDRNIDSTLVNKFLQGDRPMGDKIKDVIFTKWDNPEIPRALLGAHIRDEIEASGLSAEVSLTYKD